ncbi:MAG: type III pantothenate kinase [Clostridiales bacterium]|nr:type III pantothenate kinase [Clostridiales bacterium]MCF8023538.1 type III pantothenate kinase [Clostridiales bacterium]
MLLVFDVGNTNIVAGVFEGDQLIIDWRISTSSFRTADEYGMLLRDLFSSKGLSFNNIDAVVLSSVVPPLNLSLDEMCKKYFEFEPLVVGPGIKTGIPIKYDNPREVGADRIVNAVAGIELYGGPLILVDFGTATTFCAISQNKEYLGGSIAPGIEISTDALFSKASKLPRVEFSRPPSVIGKTTINSMQSGIFYGFVGQVNEVVSRMKDEIKGDPCIVATGGLAKPISTATSLIDKVDEWLTLKGLKIIYERNK